MYEENGCGAVDEQGRPITCEECFFSDTCLMSTTRGDE